MAFVVNRSSTVRVLAKAELTAGAGVAGTNVTPAAGTDDLLAFTNANPVQVGTSVTDIMANAFSGTFTPRPGVNTGQRSLFNIEFLMMGPGTLAGAAHATNGFASIDALLMSCALLRTTTSTTSIVYAPVAIGSATTANTLEAFEMGTASMFSTTSPYTGTGSCNIWVELGGWTHKSQGVWGNIVFEGTPSTGLVARYTGTGNYNAPTATSLASGFTGGSANQGAFLSATGALTIYGDSAYTVVGHSFRFDVGTQIAEIMDFNNATGLKGFLVTGRRPSATLIIAAEAGGNSGSTNATHAELYTAMANQTSVAWQCVVGTGTGKACTFAIPTGRITNIQMGNESGHRTYEITIVPTGQAGTGTFTAQSEFTITIN